MCGLKTSKKEKNSVDIRVPSPYNKLVAKTQGFKKCFYQSVFKGSE